MAIDSTGKELKIGDHVMLECRVVKIFDDEVLYNVYLSTVEALYQGGHAVGLSANSRQVTAWNSIPALGDAANSEIRVVKQ